MSFDSPDLKRPQYPPSPEVLLSALAWSAVERAPNTKDTGLIYARTGGRQPARLTIAQTIPNDSSYEAFRRALQAGGMRSQSGELSQLSARATAGALLGAQPAKGKNRTSSAIGLAAALLQDPTGALAVSNPPNFANLLNTLYALGGGSGSSAAEQWFQVAHHYARTPQLRGIEYALVHTTLAPFLSSTNWPPERAVPDLGSIASPVPSWWSDYVFRPGVGTPFGWFAQSWDRLCSQAWYERIPPARWAGWAVCVLRHALGFGFLWEANFYSELAMGVVDKSRSVETTVGRALAPTRPLIPYQKGGVSQMDVMPAIKQLLAKGLACRNALLTKAASMEGDLASPADLVTTLRKKSHSEVVASLTDALSGGGNLGGLKNLKETVVYSLVSRASIDVPDNHSILRKVRRNYTHVVPGPEWIVVMSATAAPTPGSALRLGDVRRSLDNLGLRPRIDFLLGELERAGLCASSPDGDEGIEINLGFAEGAR